MSRETLIPGLGERLKRLREKASLTQAEFAAKSGVSQSNISEIETGQRTPSLAVALRLADALRTSLDHLVAGKGKP